MITTFAKTTSSITAQPSTEKLIILSSSASDTTQTLSIAGVVSALPDSETLTLAGKQEIQSAKVYSTIHGVALDASCAGTLTAYKQGTAGNGRIILSANPAEGNTLAIGLVGSATVYTFTATVTTAFHVLIGADATATSINLNKSINLTGVEGTDYGTGTTIHPTLSSTVSGVILTVTDKLACTRSLGWTFTNTGTAFSLSTLIGSTQGALLWSIAIGTTTATAAISLADEALALALIPPYTTFVSDWMRTRGNPITLYLAGSNVTTPLATSYEVATDTNYPTAGQTSLTALDNNRYTVTPAEQCIEYIRLTIINTNSTAASVNAKLVSPQ